MRGLLFCLMLSPLIVFCSKTSQHNKPTASSTVQHPQNQKAENSESTIVEQEESSLEVHNKITNSIGMKLALIPKGTLMMGSTPEEEGRNQDEKHHQVTISKEYYLGVFEVTQEQYKKVLGKNPSHFQQTIIRKSDTSMHPVEKVSWDDAVDFCQRLSELPEEKKAGRVYRLPTEAEWEYACRAGSKMAYCFGDDSKSLGDYAWFNANSNAQTHPVGEKTPNAWGLYDMHGNVNEWFSDWYSEYSTDASIDPMGPSEGSLRACRGGAWNSNPFFAGRHTDVNPRCRAPKCSTASA